MISFHVHPTCGWNLHFSNLKITLALLVQLESHFAKRLEKYPIARAHAWNCNRTKRLLLWVSTAGWLFLATLQPFWKRTETWREKVDLKHNPFKSRAKAKLGSSDMNILVSVEDSNLKTLFFELALSKNLPICFKTNILQSPLSTSRILSVSTSVESNETHTQIFNLFQGTYVLEGANVRGGS